MSRSKKDRNDSDLQKDVESAVHIGLRSIKSVITGILSVILTVLLVGIIAGCVVVCAFAIYVANNIDTSIDDIMLVTETGTANGTKLYYYDDEGNLVEDETQRLSNDGSNFYVAYEDLPDNLINAFVAIEDKRFWDHNGFDLITTSKAVLKFFLPLDQSGGGSTITQQLVKNLTGKDDYTIQRKVQEILKAIELEKELGDKTKILETYVNVIYLSQGAYGVQEAAHKYFNKDVSELTLVECAAIAGITQNPSKWDPVINPEQNEYRRKVVLTAMRDQGLITQAEYEEAYTAELIIDQSETNVVSTSTNTWYTDAVIDESIDLLAEYYGVSSKVASQMLYSGGYSIITAQDKEVQAVLDKYYQDMSSTSIFPVSSVINVQSSMIIIEPDTGNILGLVGGRGKKEENRLFNLATDAVRQPGSSIKPIAVYAPSMERGIINYGTVYDDIPFNFGTVSYSSTGKPIYSNSSGWPRNSNNAYRGLTTVEYALAASKNTVAVYVLDDLGLSNSYSFLTDKLHITTLVDTDINYASLALGGLTYGVTLKELTTAYSIFSNNGVYTSSRTVLSISDGEGNVIIDNQPHKEVILSEETCQTMTKLLQQVILNSSGTAHGSLASLARITDVAGKTGTTNNNYDRWFIGYTPYYLAGIWVGFEESQNLSGIIGSEHLKMWATVITELTNQVKAKLESGESYETFESDLLIKATYCIDSGYLVTDACEADPRGARTAVGYFTRETLPTQACDAHVLVRYCVGHGVAGPNCPETGCTYVGLLSVVREFPFNIWVTDGQYTWQDLGNAEPYTGSSSYPFFWNLYRVDGKYSGRTYVGSTGQYNRYCTYHNT